MKIPKIGIAAIPVILAAVILAVMAFISAKDGTPLINRVGRAGDQPPTIEFTWSPAGAVSLLEMKAKLRLVDDRELDFKTYKMTLVEAERELKLPLAEALLGKEYEDTLSFSLIAYDPKLVGKDKLTVQIEIADNKGQVTKLEKVIKIKQIFNVDFEVR